MKRNPHLRRKIALLKGKKRKIKRNWNLRISMSGFTEDGIPMGSVQKASIAQSAPCTVQGKGEDVEIIPKVGVTFGLRETGTVTKDDFQRFSVGIARPKYVSGQQRNERAAAMSLPWAHLRKCPKCNKGMRLHPEQTIRITDSGIAPDTLALFRTLRSEAGFVQVEACRNMKCRYTVTHVLTQESFRCRTSNGASMDFMTVDDAVHGPLRIRTKAIVNDTELVYSQVAGRSAKEIRQSGVHPLVGLMRG